MDLELKGKRVLVTGASSGIGRAIALALLREGALVGLNARNQANLQELQASLGQTASRTLILPGDVGVPEQVKSIFDQLTSAWGGLLQENWRDPTGRPG